MVGAGMAIGVSLYPFQREAKKAVFKSWESGKRSTLISIPTGGGKTVVFSSITREALEGNSGRCLILAHRDSLLTQAAEKLSYVWPGVKTSMVMKGKCDFSERIVIASVQTLVNHLSKLPTFDYIVTDEAHHAYASTYRRIYEHIMAENPRCRHLGVTATPVRTNKRESLSAVFEEIAFSISIFQLIVEGFLTPLEGFSISTSLDLSKVKVRGNDYDTGDLGMAVQQGDFNETVVEKFKNTASNRKAICFAVDVNHVEMLSRLFRNKGINAIGIHGKLSKDEQARILDAYSAGRHQVLVNCMIATEGFDDPPTDCVIMARPTKSIGLYTQMVGRGIRLSPGKKECILLDFVGNTAESGLITMKDLLSFYGMTTSARIVKGYSSEDKPLSINPATIKDFSVIEEIGEEATSSGALEKINLFDLNAYAWAQYDGNYFVSARKDISIGIVREAASPERKYNVYLCQNTKDNIWYAKLNTDPVAYDFALAITNVYLYDYGDTVFAKDNCKWRNRPPSEGQLKYLRTLYVIYKKHYPHSTVKASDFTTSGHYADFINAVKTHLAIREGEGKNKETAVEALKARVAREMSIVPFDSFTKLPWEDYTLKIKGGADQDIVNRLKQMAAYLHVAYADGLPYQYVTGSVIEVEASSITIRRDKYPQYPLKDYQKEILWKKIYPIFKVLFKGEALSLDG